MKFYRKWIKGNPIKWFPLFLVSVYIFAFVTQTSYESEWKDWAKIPTVVISACIACGSFIALVVNVTITFDWVKENIDEDKKNHNGKKEIRRIL